MTQGYHGLHTQGNRVGHYACGYDFGNADAMIALFKDGRIIKNSIPTTSSAGDWKNYKKLSAGYAGNEDIGDYTMKKGEYVFQRDNIERYLGKLAMKQQVSRTTLGEITRYWLGNDIVDFLLALSASIIAEREYHLWVVTQLPVETANQPNKERMKHHLENSGQPYSFILNGKVRAATIHVMRVIPEGAGTLINEGDESIGGSKGVIDCGGRTTNLFVMDEEGVDTTRSTHISFGVEAIGSQFHTWYKTTYAMDLTPYTIRQCLRALAGQQTYPYLTVDGEPVPSIILEQMLQQYRKSIAVDIVSAIGKTWKTSEQHGRAGGNIAEVLFTGGGSYYFWDEVQQVIGERLRRIPEAEYANVIGDAILANNLIQEYRSSYRTA